MPWDFGLVFFVLGVLIPWRGRVRLRHLLLRPSVDTGEKLVLYGSTMAFQWVLSGVVLWRAVARGLTLRELGLARPLSNELAVLTVAGTLVLGAFQWFNLRRVGHTTGPVADSMRQLARRILPSKPVEFVAYFALAITAGICEEFLYRGFAIGALSRLGMAPWGVVVLSSILFGLAHSYQGRGGVLGTSLLGVVFGLVRLVSGSLLSVAVWHAAVDIVAGMAGSRYLLLPSESRGTCFVS